MCPGRGFLYQCAVWPAGRLGHLADLPRPTDSPTRQLPIDKIGLVLLVLWVGALQIMLDKGKELDWFNSGEIVALGLVALVSFVLFLVWELTEAHPVVDLSLFTWRNFVTGTLTLSVAYSLFLAAF